MHIADKTNTKTHRMDNKPNFIILSRNPHYRTKERGTMNSFLCSKDTYALPASMKRSAKTAF